MKKILKADLDMDLNVPKSELEMVPGLATILGDGADKKIEATKFEK